MGQYSLLEKIGRIGIPRKSARNFGGTGQILKDECLKHVITKY